MNPDYTDTRRGLRQLVKDARPGNRIYTVTERATIHPSQDRKVYEEWVVTDKKAFGSGTYYVKSTANGGELSLEQILGKHRGAWRTKPAGIPNAAAQVRHETYNDAAHRAAQAVADRHAEEVANRLSRQYASSR
ncbi:hypothetical protein ABGT92_23815 [Streptomyces cinereoruber]|uniref:hypothetical protein n=1 Tax=Streptomyces cinereoruber TaxID=67260 RepID=UPI00345D4E5C